MEEKKWFYALNGERLGPVDISVIRKMIRKEKLSPRDLVWQPDFGSEWREIRQVAALADALPFLPDAPLPETVPGADAETGNSFAGPVPMSGVRGGRPYVFRAVGLAYRRTVAVLFRAFSFSRWFSIGFCAWIGGGWGGGIRGVGNSEAWENFTSAIRDIRGPEAGKAVAETFKKAFPWLRSDPKVLTLVVPVAILVLLLIVVSYWINSRGVFMFLHRWYHPDSRIGESWAVSRDPGWSLFLWRLGFLAVILLVTAGYALLAWRNLAIPFLQGGSVWKEPLLIPFIVVVACGVLLALLFFAIHSVLVEFVAPVMYVRQVSVSQGWLAVFSLFAQYPFRLIGYYLVKGLLRLAFLLVVLLAVISTCCIALLLLAIPYIGTVLLLPVFYFFRGYSVCYISQWRPDLVREE